MAELFDYSKAETILVREVPQKYMCTMSYLHLLMPNAASFCGMVAMRSPDGGVSVQSVYLIEDTADSVTFSTYVWGWPGGYQYVMAGFPPGVSVKAEVPLTLRVYGDRLSSAALATVRIYSNMEVEEWQAR